MSGVAATIGVFDGVHLGHRFVIDRTREAANGGRTVVFTFDPHPAAVLAPDRAPRLLTSTPEKIVHLEQAGADQVVVIRFDREVAALGPQEFVDRYLLPGRDLRHLVIGHDFALGKDRTGDATRLTAIGKERGFAVTRLPALRHDGVVVSSTRIREALTAGDLEAVRDLLGRRFSAMGVVVAGEGRGRLLGYPTANVSLPPEKLMPPFGVYAVVTTIDPGEPDGGKHPAVMNFGKRPTFEGVVPTVEAHLLDFSGDLTGRTLGLELVAWIRAERKFESVAALVDQIRRDSETARGILAVR